MRYVVRKPTKENRCCTSLKRGEAQAVFGGGVAVTIVGSYGVLGGIA